MGLSSTLSTRCSHRIKARATWWRGCQTRLNPKTTGRPHHYQFQLAVLRPANAGGASQCVSLDLLRLGLLPSFTKDPARGQRPAWTVDPAIHLGNVGLN